MACVNEKNGNNLEENVAQNYRDIKSEEGSAGSTTKGWKA